MAIIPTSGEFVKVPDGGGSENRFVVMCTPTAADLSGTMDKTAEEILDAYEEGKSIYFQVANVGTFLATSYAYNTFGTNIVDSNNDRLVHVYTARTGNLYYTKMY